MAHLAVVFTRIINTKWGVAATEDLNREYGLCPPKGRAFPETITWLDISWLDPISALVLLARDQDEACFCLALAMHQMRAHAEENGLPHPGFGTLPSREAWWLAYRLCAREVFT